MRTKTTKIKFFDGKGNFSKICMSFQQNSFLKVSFQIYFSLILPKYQSLRAGATVLTVTDIYSGKFPHSGTGAILETPPLPPWRGGGGREILRNL